MPSAKIESNDKRINKIATQIAVGETDVVLIAQEVAVWTPKSIRYDSNLANKIWNGEVSTQSAFETMDLERGTCSEYANVFIAIMRNKGIPARFVMGKMYFGFYQAQGFINHRAKAFLDRTITRKIKEKFFNNIVYTFPK